MIIRIVEDTFDPPVIDTEFVAEERTYNNFDYSHLDTTSTFWSYEDDEYDTIAGIDVSEHQGIIDWSKVKESGAEFAMIRIGYRGTESGICTEDPYFQQNIEGALANNMKIGIYFFSQAITVEEASEEAWFVLRRIEGYDIDMPIVFDMEYPEIGTNRIGELTPHEKTKIAMTFLETIRQNGYTPMVYGSSYTIGEHFEMQYLTDYSTWIADYDTEVKYSYEFSMWQYSDSLRIDGISTNVDADMWFVRK